MRYTFGSSETAEKRLEDLASFWNPLSEQWVRSLIASRPGVALDLGCGPGFSTAMLDRATGASRTIGLDNSAAFLKAARQRHPHCSFLEHDVMRLPLPIPADLIYGRFLLAHLPNPERLLEGWLSQVQGGGLLLIEEPEAIDTSVPVFREYLDLAAGMVAAQGADLFVGRRLAGALASVRALANKGTLVPVTTARAAGWMLRNVEAVWAADPYILAHSSADLRRTLRARLSALATGEAITSEIRWTIRRIAFASGSRKCPGDP